MKSRSVRFLYWALTAFLGSLLSNQTMSPAAYVLISGATYLSILFSLAAIFTSYKEIVKSLYK